MPANKIQRIIRLSTPRETSPRNSQNVVAVARQPIFDAEGAIWAYELLFRDPSMKPGLGGRSSHAATSSVMVEGFELMRPSLQARQRFFINFTEEMLEAELASILPPEYCVIEILETVQPTEEVMIGLRHLKEQGYLLALDDFFGQPELIPFLDIVDIVKVEVLGHTHRQLRDMVGRLKPLNLRLLAEKVEDVKTAGLCRELSFSLFQGFFYSKAEVVRGKKLSPSQITKARLLSYSSSDMEEDISEVVDAISADVYLSYKLLRYVNSAFLGLRVPATNVRHAIAILGRQKLRQWLCVTALAEMDSTPMARELVLLSALRAKFLELLAEKAAHGRKELPRALFLIGLFSLLESMLQIPMREILSTLPLEPDQVDALVFRKGPYAPWMDLLDAYEQGHWDEVWKIAGDLSLAPADLAVAYAEAGKWSAALFGEPGEKSAEAVQI
ncbi:MAG: HDOD domain-containing protein [Deltaproteobacteria bacterium]|nr:HDOD domain-containing protein [Deltaproteobacteria bacterium]